MVKLEEPDKGRAWLIAAASFIICMITFGINKIDGLVYVEFIEYLNVSRQDASLPFTLRSAARFLFGPVAGVIGQRYGIGVTTFWGGFIATVATAICWIAPNIIWLCIFYGVITGIGIAFSNMLFNVAINQYFEKYRATAAGIAHSGITVAGFLFPVIIDEALHTFGLPGGILIISGILMHILPASLLLKTPLWIKNPQLYERLKSLKMKQESFIKTGSVLASFENKINSEDQHLERNDLKRTTTLNDCHVSELKDSSTMPSERFQSPTVSTVSGNMEKIESNNGLMRPSEKIHKVPSKDKRSLLEIIRGISILYTNPGYLLVDFTLASYTIIFFPVVVVYIDYAKDKGFGSYAVEIIIAANIGNLIARLGLGWVSDKKFLTLPKFVAVSYTLQGLILVLLPLVTNLYLFMLLFGLHGIATSTLLVNYQLLVPYYAGTHLQSLAMGCKEFLSGLAAFAISPLIGHFRDNVGSYDNMFYLLGIISVVNGIAWFLEPLIVKLRCTRDLESKDPKEVKKQNST